MSSDESIPVVNAPSSGKPRSNSTSSVHASEIMQAPDRYSTLVCIGLILQAHISRELDSDPIKLNEEFNISTDFLAEFDNDEIHLSSMIADLKRDDEIEKNLAAGSIPMSTSIARLIGALQWVTNSSIDRVIIAFIYFNRVIDCGRMIVTTENWRMLWVISFILANKVWCENPEKLSTFAMLLPGVSVEQLNSLERKVLQLIEHNTSCSRMDYAKQYFDLHNIFLAKICTTNSYAIWRLKPLSQRGAAKFLLRSSNFRMSQRRSPSGGSSGSAENTQAHVTEGATVSAASEALIGNVALATGEMALTVLSDRWAGSIAAGIDPPRASAAAFEPHSLTDSAAVEKELHVDINAIFVTDATVAWTEGALGEEEVAAAAAAARAAAARDGAGVAGGVKIDGFHASKYNPEASVFEYVDDTARLAGAVHFTADHDPSITPSFNPQNYTDWTTFTGEQLAQMAEEAAQGETPGEFAGDVFVDEYDEDDDWDNIDMYGDLGPMLQREYMRENEERLEASEREADHRLQFERFPGQPLPARRWSFDGAFLPERSRFVLS